MKTSHLINTALVLGMTIFTSCAPRLAGTWTVQRYETVTPGQQGVTLSNIGTMTFNRDGSGEKSLNYAVLGTTVNDQTPFKWTWSNDSYVTIESAGSDFAKTWIIITNKKKFQKWKSTDGANNIQTLEISKN